MLLILVGSVEIIHILVVNLINFIMRIFILFVFVVYNFFCNSVNLYCVVEPIHGVSFAQQVFWISDTDLIIVQDEKILSYNINSRMLDSVDTRIYNEFVGWDYDNNSLMFCEFYHYWIYDYDEFSSLFKVYDSEHNLVNEIKIFETVRPVYMDSEIIIAVTSVDILEQHLYKIDIVTGIKEEIDLDMVTNTVLASDSIVVSDVFPSSSNRYVVEDIFGNLYVYNIFDFTFIRDLFSSAFNIVYDHFLV